MCCSASRCAGAAHGWRCRARRGRLVGRPSTAAAAFSAEVLFASQSGGTDLAPDERADCCQSALRVDQTGAGGGRQVLRTHDPSTSTDLGWSREVTETYWYLLSHQ